MKRKLLRAALILGSVAMVLGFFGCPRPRPFDGNDGNHGIIILPEGDQSGLTKNWQAIQAVLHKPTGEGEVDRKYLFRIREYTPDNSRKYVEDGSLEDAMLLIDVDQVDGQARQSGFKGHTIQIGVGLVPDYRTIPKQTPTPTPGHAQAHVGPPTPQGHHIRQQIAESEKMVQEINDILRGAPTATPTSPPTGSD